MSFDFAIDSATGDLSIKKGAFVIAKKSDEVGQRVKTRLLRQLGEWFLDVTAGVPWYDTPDYQGLLGSKRKDETELLMRSTVTATDGVSSIKSFERIETNSGHNLTFNIVLITVFGETAIQVGV